MSALLEVEMMQKIGFIGLGIMGTPMARLLLKAGYQVNIYARTDVHVKPLAEEGGIARQTPKEIAEHSDVIITMLPDSRVVEEVMFGENGVYEGLEERYLWIWAVRIMPALKESARNWKKKGSECWMPR